MTRVQDELRALLDSRLAPSLTELLQAEVERRALVIAEQLAREAEQSGGFERGVQWWAAEHIALVAMLRQLGSHQPLWLHHTSAEQVGAQVTEIIAARLPPSFWSAAHTFFVGSLSSFLQNGSLSRGDAVVAGALETVGLFGAFEGCVRRRLLVALGVSKPLLAEPSFRCVCRP